MNLSPPTTHFSGRWMTRSASPAKWLQRLATALGLTLALAGGQTAQASPPATLRNIVLVHGAFTDGSSWSPVIRRLQAMGYHVTAVQNPLTSLADDVSATEKVLRRQSGGVLLVGHSWGGVVITQAGNAANVKGLVYLSALAPDSGESASDLLQSLGAPMDGFTPDADGLIWLDDVKRFHDVMAADLPVAKARDLVSAQHPISVVGLTDKIKNAAWRDKPSWYLETAKDQALKPAVQQAIARRIGARTTTIQSSHMSMLSQSDYVARLIDRAAKEAARQPRRIPGISSEARPS